jgi:hypothetical protein
MDGETELVPKTRTAAGSDDRTGTSIMQQGAASGTETSHNN